MHDDRILSGQGAWSPQELVVERSGSVFHPIGPRPDLDRAQLRVGRPMSFHARLSAYETSIGTRDVELLLARVERRIQFRLSGGTCGQARRGCSRKATEQNSSDQNRDLIGITELMALWN
jgi:hypothetical protein